MMNYAAAIAPGFRPNWAIQKPVAKVLKAGTLRLLIFAVGSSLNKRCFTSAKSGIASSVVHN